MPPSVLPRLYLITDRKQTANRPLTSVVQETIQAGVRLIQVREKDLPTRELIQFTQSVMALMNPVRGIVLMNDRVDLVIALSADGVHLRADSLPLSQARRLLGDRRIIGISTHSIEEVRKAQGEGADFIVFGPVFDTPSKRAYGSPLGLSLLEEACHASTLPIYAIGGISPAVVPTVLSCGAYGIAVISSILQAPYIPDIVQEYVSRLS